jgi:hypothetical protein
VLAKCEEAQRGEKRILLVIASDQPAREKQGEQGWKGFQTLSIPVDRKIVTIQAKLLLGRVYPDKESTNETFPEEVHERADSLRKNRCYRADHGKKICELIVSSSLLSSTSSA